ncbi:MAG TPA: cyclomaltodextrinase C-terminal domain-containing protein, partial [Cytophaga sp.]|nr:cyclomaltodextrinase C-terminal domain-containing protein [Cytophaga sp.]
SLDSAINSFDTAYLSNALHLYFTSNHDENTWNKADYGTMPGKTHAPFAILTQTMKLNVPLVYSGQEEPILRPLRFFDKDTITFEKFQRAAFYKKLLLLRKYNPVLASDAAFKRIHTNNDKDVYAYIRYANKKFVFVLLNLSNKKQTIKLKGNFPLEANTNTANIFDVMKGVVKKNNLTTTFNLTPWDYKVLMSDDAAIEKSLAQ